MGWTTYYNRPRDEAQEIRNLLKYSDDAPFTSEILKLQKVSSIWFAAVKLTPKTAPFDPAFVSGYTLAPDGSFTFCAVFLTSVTDGGWGYKDMTEDMGPCAHHSKCPPGVLKLLSPTTNEHALGFRERSRNYQKIKSMIPGQKIKIPDLGVFEKVSLPRLRGVWRDSDGGLTRISSGYLIMGEIL